MSQVIIPVGGLSEEEHKLARIRELEAEGNTPRRIREAITTPEGMLWLSARNDEIKELRKELKK